MSIYGSLGASQEAVENLFSVNEAEYQSQRQGLFFIKECRKNVGSVPVFVNEHIYYVASTDLERFMEANDVDNVEDAVADVASYNNIDESDITVVYDGCSEYIKEALAESSIMFEASVEDNAMSLKQVNKWYSKVISASKSKAESKEEIKARINVLKDCVKAMERQKKDVMKDAGIVKYVLKDMIPFNSLYRLIKRQDAYAGLGLLSSIVLNSVIYVASHASYNLPIAMVVRGVTYKKMLQANIDKTNDAIEFLEKKLKEF